MRKLTQRLLLALLSSVLTLLALELVYRGVLWRSPVVSEEVDSFDATARSLYRFDEQFGYAYIPDATARSVRVDEGRVTHRWESRVNSQGNIGDPTISQPWNDSDMRILVVGDSFTANPDFGGIAWPDYLCRDLRNRSIDNAAVRNLGRDGYGVLQMLTMAA